MRWTRDEIDIWCEQWASQRRTILGLGEIHPRERIGRLTSTLGAVREEGEGASQASAASRNMPEVYTGDAFYVNKAFKHMNPSWRVVMESHYVFTHWELDGKRKRILSKEKARFLNLSISLYWTYLKYAKNCVLASVHIGKSMETA